VWSVPPSVAETLGLALVESVSEPALTVAVAVTFAAAAEDAATASSTTGRTKAEISFRRMHSPSWRRTHLSSLERVAVLPRSRVCGYDFAWFQSSPTPTSTARGGSSGYA